MEYALPPVIVWFRDDLRLADNPALTAALETGQPVIGLYVLDEDSPGIRPLGGAARWWLHHSLLALESDLAKLDINLVLRRGAAAQLIDALVQDVGATAVFWNRRYGGPERTVDTQVKKHLIVTGLEADSFAANLLLEPWTVQTQKSQPYSVFTPFWRACLAAPMPRLPLPDPRVTGPRNRAKDAGNRMEGVANRTTGPGDHAQPRAEGRSNPAALDRLSVHDLDLLPRNPDWSGGLSAAWTPGEKSAQAALETFTSGRLDGYVPGRDIPSQPSTSLLSPHLRWGEISPFQVWHAVVSAQPDPAHLGEGARVFLSEIGWREFAWHTLFHFPDLATSNWREGFDAFPWSDEPGKHLDAWKSGETGFTLVDAGMRQLWRSGWMHNRVRMVTASFLTKNLLVDWRIGEEWFWDTLVDADPASNPFNWQWVAGTGADASPYYRIFNPDLQAKKFDPEERYVRANIPQWGTPDYPDPIVDLRESRLEALAAYQEIRS